MPAYNLLQSCMLALPTEARDRVSGKMRLHTLLQKLSQTSAYYAPMRNISIGNGLVGQDAFLISSLPASSYHVLGGART